MSVAASAPNMSMQVVAHLQCQPPLPSALQLEVEAEAEVVLAIIGLGSAQASCVLICR